MADETGVRFIPTSPAIPNTDTALLYPGMGLLEGINVNEGRGTGKAFRICAAPWINGSELQQVFMKKDCPGISCQPCFYTAAEGLYANQNCYGLEFLVTDKNDFRPVAAGISLLQSITALYPEHVEERLYTTRANPSGIAHLDKLLGIKNAFMKIKTGETISTDVAGQWNFLVKPFLLY